MPSLEDNSPSTVYECLESGIPFLASDAGGTTELIAPEDRDRVLFAPTSVGVERALERTLGGANGLHPARPAFDVDESLARWQDVVAMEPPAPKAPDPPAAEIVVTRSGQDRAARVRAANSEWIVLLAEDDRPRDGLLDTLTRAQAASGADVVTCAIDVDTDEGTVQHYFLGDPGALGVLSNSYGTVALIRRSLLLEHMTSQAVGEDPDWPLLARLAATGARIVSIPLPLVARSRPPGKLERHPSDALLVVRALERSGAHQLRSIARLAAGLAADLHAPRPTPRQGMRTLVRRARRLFART